LSMSPRNISTTTLAQTLPTLLNNQILRNSNSLVLRVQQLLKEEGTKRLPPSSFKIILQPHALQCRMVMALGTICQPPRTQPQPLTPKKVEHHSLACSTTTEHHLSPQTASSLEKPSPTRKSIQKHRTFQLDVNSFLNACSRAGSISYRSPTTM